MVQLRIPPPPIPLSWGRNVQPFDPDDAALSSMLVSRLSIGSPDGSRPHRGAASRGSLYGQWVVRCRAAGAASGVVEVAADGKAAAAASTSFPSGFGSDTGLPQKAEAASAETSCSYYEVKDLPSFKFDGWSWKRASFQAVLINSGWEMDGSDDRWLERLVRHGHGMNLKLSHMTLIPDPPRFKRLPLTRLCPSGFVFVWAHKMHLHPVTKQLYQWGYQ